ncbi:cytochrome c [Roseovarius sp.]|uniref:c-type cytochrome n=1 Tax=Roseovarius sp. TaxID=1486281 RepID=UPI002580DF98|nr:cytochrome c [Roseovarius sp.]
MIRTSTLGILAKPTALGALLLTLAACNGVLQPAPKPIQVMPDRTDGATFFAQNCASCHGDSGRGDGPRAKTLPQRPTDLTQLSTRNGGDYPAARTLSYIYGDPQKSHLARVMPEFSNAMSDDLVPVEIDGVFTPTPPQLAGLLAYLESIQD